MSGSAVSHSGAPKPSSELKSAGILPGSEVALCDLESGGNSSLLAPDPNEVQYLSRSPVQGSPDRIQGRCSLAHSRIKKVDAVHEQMHEQMASYCDVGWTCDVRCSQEAGGDLVWDQ